MIILNNATIEIKDNTGALGLQYSLVVSKDNNNKKFYHDDYFIIEKWFNLLATFLSDICVFEKYIFRECLRSGSKSNVLKIQLKGTKKIYVAKCIFKRSDEVFGRVLIIFLIS